MAKRKAQSQSSGGTFAPVAFLVAAIRAAAQANTMAAVDYILRPQSWTAKDSERAARSAQALTKAKDTSLDTLRAALMSLCNVTSLESAAKVIAEGGGPRFYWQHQRIAPLALPGQVQRPSIQAHYEAAVRAGIVSPATDYGTAMAEGVASKVLGQRPVRGGYLVYVAEDWESRPQRVKARSDGPRDLSGADVLNLL